MIQKSENFAEILEKLKALEKFVPNLMFGIKNLNSEIVHFSESYAKFLGFNVSDVIGKKTNYDLYDDKEIDKVLEDEDKLVIQSRQTLYLLKIHKVTDSLKPHICMKFPILDENNYAVGIMFQSIEMSIYNFGQHVTNSHELLSQNNLQVPKLTKREQQVAYLFMNHLTSQEIAGAISQIEKRKISKSTIDSVFNDQLYLKFNVYNRLSLLKALEAIGYNK